MKTQKKKKPGPKIIETKKKTYSITLSTQARKKLERLSKKSYCSMSQWIEWNINSAKESYD